MPPIDINKTASAFSGFQCHLKYGAEITQNVDPSGHQLALEQARRGHGVARFARVLFGSFGSYSYGL